MTKPLAATQPRHSKNFQLHSEFKPQGDQPQAIAAILSGFQQQKHQTLLGVTGSGKTFTMAHVIEKLNVPTLVIAHNKTLAAQLYEEFRQFFPENAVEYFVSYYDYYQPEAYVPSTDTYIDKESTINDAIDRMRHSATRSLLERQDVIIVSSVSCIYGLGSPEAYQGTLVFLQVGDIISPREVIDKLLAIQYQRNEYDFHRGTFRLRGDTLEIFPAHEEEQAVRLEWFGETLEAIRLIDPLRGHKKSDKDKIAIYPSSHYVVTKETRQQALLSIAKELEQQLQALLQENRLVEAQRLEQRTRFDLEMLEEIGYCNGIENYSRHLTAQEAGQPPPTLLNYFPKDYLLLIDESHQTIPQLGAMYRGDRARKETLVRYGFRLPSALDNRPLRFEEFQQCQQRTLYVSATPGDFELETCQGVVVEQIIRPTGLVDPVIEIRPTSKQVDDLLGEIQKTTEQKQRTLVSTLTKRMAEELSDFYQSSGILVRYMHSDIDTLERIALLRDLRLGSFDVLVGINLLREGLDLPEVALVAVLDADKEGFLRSSRSLIQIAGRAARNIDGRVLFYADRMTPSIVKTIDETSRRRQKQLAYNEAHGIVPQSTRRALLPLEQSFHQINGEKEDPEIKQEIQQIQHQGKDAVKLIEDLRKAMRQKAQALDFEEAARLRDKIKSLEAYVLQTI